MKNGDTLETSVLDTRAPRLEGRPTAHISARTLGDQHAGATALPDATACSPAAEQSVCPGALPVFVRQHTGYRLIIFIRRVAAIAGLFLAGLLCRQDRFIGRILYVSKSHKCRGRTYDIDGLSTPLRGSNGPSAARNRQHSGQPGEGTFKNCHLHSLRCELRRTVWRYDGDVASNPGISMPPSRHESNG